MRSAAVLLFQSGVQLPRGVRYRAARMKHWPEQTIPQNFHFTAEQKFKGKAFPRDTGKIPRDFVLSVLYRHQPCEVAELWSHCLADPRIVLDSKRHLRSVLGQMRAEGFITFELNSQKVWECHLTRERYTEVRQLVSTNPNSSDVPLQEATSLESSNETNDRPGEADPVGTLKMLEQQLAETTAKLHNYQKVEVDYLPYTDLNGKVNFMWCSEEMNSVFSPLFSEEDIVFYKSTLYREIQDGPIGKSHGANMMRTLRKELIRSVEANHSSVYTATVGELMKVVTDSLMSAVHRSAPHELINRTMRDYHILTDEEEYHYLREEGNFEMDAEETEMSSNSDIKSTVEFKRQKEDAKRKRLEDEEILIKEKRVTDDKGRTYRTLGPFPAPRLSLRTKTYTFPSRKSLQHKTVVEAQSASSSSDDEEEEATVPSISIEMVEAKEHLTAFLAPLSIDSLKKVGESAKAKLKPSTPHDEFVSEIVKTAAKLGFEKGFLLIDKQKLPEDVTGHQATPLPTTAKIEYLMKLPDSQRQALGNALGFPEENPPVADMWERMLAMGFLSVLTNLRLKPLKKIAQELNIVLPNTNSTEKFCEAVVFAAFPRERIRAKISRAKQKKVKFSAYPNEMFVRGDMGYITFHVSNISMLLHESEKHYSPEFFFANMKWSLLCMTSKDCLALYLCQTGSIYCKFIITVVNLNNAIDSICNEGTQSFQSSSQENDWGFCSVIKLSQLLNPSQGFVKAGSDTITIEVGIVLVEPLKDGPKEKAPIKEKKSQPRINENAFMKILEDEQAENMKKKIKQDLARNIKDEDKNRKDITQKATKAFHDLTDRLKHDTKRLVKEIAERQKREELEELKELEKIRQAEEQTKEMKRGLEGLKSENSKLLQEKKELTQEIKDIKRTNDKLSQEAKSISERIQSSQLKLKTLEKKVETAAETLQRVREEEPATPSPTEEDEDEDPLKDDHLHRFMHEIASENN